MRAQTELATRALILTLKAPFCGKSTAEIASLTGVSTRTVDRIWARAIERGFDPAVLPVVLKDEYLEDAPRSGRPSKHTPTNQNLVVAKIREERYDREKTSAVLAAELTAEGIPISAKTVRSSLRKANLPKNEANEEARPDTEYARRPATDTRSMDESVKSINLGRRVDDVDRTREMPRDVVGDMVCDLVGHPQMAESHYVYKFNLISDNSRHCITAGKAPSQAV
ncbi:hypothetical protein BB8028_0002g14290 [Beauveria bassiana]|uniref:Transposase Tc1-like domain-containing protein n=1 Tax=Beauveria bassiana TaxID=176275 RepID=A0A2S7Y4P2_BEABA|nr:hypothetical protein BB8028_0002g14290 [Beauveria bassiana]